jgi:hypothetical protein
MKKILATLTLVFIFIGAYAQKDVKFQVKFKPDFQYSTDLKVITTSEIDFDGDEAVLNQIKSSGMTLPMMVNMNQTMVSVMKTGKYNKESEVPITVEFSTFETEQTMNGQAMPGAQQLSGMKMTGWGDKSGKVRYDSIESASMNEETKKLTIDIIEKMQNQVLFPEKPMKVGEEFTQEIPMSIPIAGASPLNLVITTIYKLKSIKGDIATFDTKQTVALDANLDQGTAAASGDGTGTMEFDMKQSYISKFKSVMAMDFEVQAGPVKIKARTKADSDQVVKFGSL